MHLDQETWAATMCETVQYASHFPALISCLSLFSWLFSFSKDQAVATSFYTFKNRASSCVSNSE